MYQLLNEYNVTNVLWPPRRVARHSSHTAQRHRRQNTWASRECVAQTEWRSSRSGVYKAAASGAGGWGDVLDEELEEDASAADWTDGRTALTGGDGGCAVERCGLISGRWPSLLRSSSRLDRLDEKVSIAHIREFLSLVCHALLRLFRVIN